MSSARLPMVEQMTIDSRKSPVYACACSSNGT
jgi:hypothetical protein